MAEVVDLTANYILNDKKRTLEMALHVYRAMPTVHWRVVGEIWEGVLGRITNELGKDVIEHEQFDDDDPYYGFAFWKKDGTFCLWAGTENVLSRGTADGPVFGVWVYDKDRACVEPGRLQELVDCFKEATNGIGEVVDDETNNCQGIVFPRVNVGKKHPQWDSGKAPERVPNRWGGDILPKVIEHREEIEMSLAELLLQTYRFVEERLL